MRKGLPFMIKSEKVSSILKQILDKEKEMAQDKDIFNTKKSKEKEVKKIIVRLVKEDEV